MSEPLNPRATHRPVSAHMDRSSAAGKPVRKPESSNVTFAFGFFAGAIVALLVVLFVLLIDDTSSSHVSEGDRVCVEYTEADGYFCGPVVFTGHDIFRG